MNDSCPQVPKDKIKLSIPQKSGTYATLESEIQPRRKKENRERSRKVA